MYREVSGCGKHLSFAVWKIGCYDWYSRWCGVVWCVCMQAIVLLLYFPEDSYIYNVGCVPHRNYMYMYIYMYALFGRLG